MAWSSHDTYLTPFGPVTLFGNAPRLGESVLEELAAFRSVPSDPAENTVFLFHGRKTGWVLVRDGNVRSISSRKSDFRQMLLFELLGLAAASFESAVLFSGRLLELGRSRRFEVPVESGNPLTAGSVGNELILVVEDRPRSNQLAASGFPYDFPVVPAPKLLPSDLVLGDLGKASDLRSTSLSCDEAYSLIMHGVRGFGRNPEASRRFLKEMVTRHDAIHWRGTEAYLQLQLGHLEGATSVRDLLQVCFREAPGLVEERVGDGSRFHVGTSDGGVSLELNRQAYEIFNTLRSGFTIYEILDEVRESRVNSAAMIRTQVEALAISFLRHDILVECELAGLSSEK